MPVQQITVVPLKETGSSSKRAPRSKDKTEGRKASGRSGSRPSHVSKAGNSTTGQSTTSKASVAPSSGDTCSPLTRVEEAAPEPHKRDKRTHSPEMTVASAPLASSAQAQKKQVKRRHRRKKSVCAALDCADGNGKQEQTDRSERSLSSDHCEKRERSAKSRRELPPRLRRAGTPPSDSSTEGEAWRQARSWSKEKARRGRRRSGSSRERDGAQGGEDQAGDRVEVLELQSVGSEEGRDGRPRAEDGDGLKKRRGSQSAVRKEDEHLSQGREKETGGSSSPAEDEEELITKRYQEKGSGSADMSVPAAETRCAGYGGSARLCSEDSEQEVCRICHCEGEEECPLIMPCRCTGTLSFVHQTCLNQWIKSSDTRCCELCKFDFIMETSLKPLCKWEKLHMPTSERRKIFCSVFFHLVAIVCMLWSLYILLKRTLEEIRLGKNEDLWRVSLLKYYTEHAILEWPFWTKLIVVAIGFAGGVIFMYIQCKVYLQLWRRLKAFNRIITVQNCPEKDQHHPRTTQTGAVTNGRHGSVVVPVLPPQAAEDSDLSVEDAVAPAQSPV